MSMTKHRHRDPRGVGKPVVAPRNGALRDRYQGHPSDNVQRNHSAAQATFCFGKGSAQRRSAWTGYRFVTAFVKDYFDPQL